VLEHHVIRNLAADRQPARLAIARAETQRYTVAKLVQLEERKPREASKVQLIENKLHPKEQ
jgi:hypothetical protein